MDPQGRGGIGEAAEGEGVGREQKAEVVLHKGQGNGAEGKNGETQRQKCGGGSDGETRETLSARELRECAFDAREPG